MSKIKGKNFFVAHFHNAFRPRPLIPFDLRPEFCAKWQLKGLITLHNPDKILEDSSFGSHFTDLQKLA